VRAATRRTVGARTELFVFQFSDGQELGQVDSIGHWDMARFLLDMVKPDKNALRSEPGRDDWVRRGTAPPSRTSSRA
jgi:hypothetical protein